MVFGHPYKLEIWDVSAKDEHNNLRRFAYSKADVIILCFSLMDPPSFHNI